MGDAADAAGVSERTAYKWLRRHREEGHSGLLDRTSRPRRMPQQLGEKWRQLVLELRREHRMTGKAIAQRLRLGRSTVSRLLRRHRPSRARDLEPKLPPRRYERSEPGELLHLDVKKLGRIKGVGHRITGVRTHRNRGIGWDYVHVCIDDYSRLAYVEVLENEKAVTTHGFLQRAIAWFERHGIQVREIMTDNGSPYVSRLFRHAINERSLRHIRTRPYTPRTNGKAERFIQTTLREWAYARPYTSSAERARALKKWLRHYNLKRPHGSLDDRPPISRLDRAAWTTRRHSTSRPPAAAAGAPAPALRRRPPGAGAGTPGRSRRPGPR